MLFIMRSVSCGGKSTFVDKHFGANSPHVLSSDTFRAMLSGDVNYQQVSAEVFRMIYKIVESRFEHRANWTVVDAMHLQIRDVTPLIELCKKYHHPFTIIGIEPPEVDVLIKRGKYCEQVSGKMHPAEKAQRHYDRYFNAKQPFIEEAIHNSLCKYIEVDQQYEVIREI